MKQKSIKKNMVMNIILTVSNFVFPLITYSYVARVLTPSGTGEIAFVDSILAYFLYLASLGIPAYGRREVAKIRDDKIRLSKLVHELFIFNLCATIVAYCMLWLIVLFIPELRIKSLLFLIMGSQIILKLLGVEWFYEGMEEYSYITIRSLIFKTISVLLTFILIKSPNDVLWYGFIHIFTISASYICNFFNLRKYIFFKPIGNYKLKKHFKTIIILFSASIAVTIYANFDVSMIGFISGEYDVGLYNAALKIKSIVMALSTAISAVLVPRMSYYFGKNEDKKIIDLLSKSLRVSNLIALPVAVYVIIQSENLLSFIAGNDYIPAANTLRILMLCIFALIATNICGVQILIPMGKEKRYTQSVVVGLFINLFLNLLMIPSLGAFGAAIGTLITETWNVCWMGSGCIRYLKLILKKVSIIKYLIAMILAGIPCIIICLFVSNYSAFIQLTITTIIFFGVFYVIMIYLKEPLILEICSKIIAKTKKEKK